MTDIEKQNEAIARVLADDPVTTIIEAVTETSVLADALSDGFQGCSGEFRLKKIIEGSINKDQVQVGASLVGIGVHRIFVEAIRQYALEVAIKKGYYDEP